MLLLIRGDKSDPEDPRRGERTRAGPIHATHVAAEHVLLRGG